MDKDSMTARLKEPFSENVVHWRIGATNARKLSEETGREIKPWQATSGIALAYITARDVMKRLDEVCGDNWQAEYPFLGCCRIGIKVDDEWIWRSNGAGETDVEGEKGQYSDAFKRAAVLWGVGRYLYYLPNVWCDLIDGKIINPPEVPSWAKPGTAPETLDYTREAKKKFDLMIENGADLDMYVFAQGEETSRMMGNLYNSFKDGSIVKYKRIVDDMLARGFKLFDVYVDAAAKAISDGDELAIEQLSDEVSDEVWEFIERKAR